MKSKRYNIERTICDNFLLSASWGWRLSAVGRWYNTSCHWRPSRRSWSRQLPRPPRPRPTPPGTAGWRPSWPWATSPSCVTVPCHCSISQYMCFDVGGSTPCSWSGGHCPAWPPSSFADGECMLKVISPKWDLFRIGACAFSYVIMIIINKHLLAFIVQFISNCERLVTIHFHLKKRKDNFWQTTHHKREVGWEEQFDTGEENK